MSDVVPSGRTPAEKLVHDMLNCLFTMQLTVRELPLTHHNDAEFKKAQDSLLEDITTLREMIARAEEILKAATLRGENRPTA